MAISSRRLGHGEYVVASTRTHGKALVRPALALLALCWLTGFLLAAVSTRSSRWLAWVVLAVAALSIAQFCVKPFLRWLTASYTVTNYRLLSRSGLVRKTGRDIPLARIVDVRYERGILDRMIGCGTLVVSDASETGGIVLPDVPHAEALQLTIADLLQVQEGWSRRWSSLSAQ